MTQKIPRPASAPPRPELLESRESARAKLEDRIKRGQGLSGIDTGDPGGLNRLEAEYQNWSRYNRTLLGSLFSTDQLQREYSECTPHDVVNSPLTGPQRVRRVRMRAEAQSRCLTSIAERLELYRTASPISLGSGSSTSSYRKGAAAETATSNSDADKRLLAEIEDILRTTPDASVHRHPTDDNFAWFGRAQAAVGRWDPAKGEIFRKYVSSFQSVPSAREAASNRPRFMSMLHEARADIRSRVAEPLAEVFAEGQVFRYFDEVRKLIELAQEDILFIDPYINAEFISRFLPNVRQGVKVRLLTSKDAHGAVQAADLFSKERNLAISIRSEPSLHDRLVFVDGRECYVSGGSFKDGAKRSPGMLMQISDAFPAVRQIYETKWSGAKVERP